MDIITVNGLRKTYKTYERGSGFLESLKSVFVRTPVYVDALKGISFNVAEGEILGLLGPNGAGKSTTIKILTGVLYPTSGEVDVMGYIPWNQRKRYVANIGAVFGQKSQLIWDIPPIDSFEMNRAIYGISSGDYKKRLNALTEMLELGDLINRPTRQLSLGERMKCEFIMAMLHDPRIVFLDEPTIGVDVIAKDRIREFIAEKNRQGTTLILTTHDISDIEKLAKRIIIVNHGEIVCDDTPEKLQNYFGSIKIVNLATDGPMPDTGTLEGVIRVLPLPGGRVEFELNTDILPLNGFIDYIGRRAVINDITIRNTDIESVIKTFYGATSTPGIK